MPVVSPESKRGKIQVILIYNIELKNARVCYSNCCKCDTLIVFEPKFYKAHKPQQ